MNIPTKYEQAIRENREIEFNGLLLYPLRVRDYGLFYAAKPAFELVQASLSPALARLSWFPCLGELDRRSAEEFGAPAGLMNHVLLVLAAACRAQPVYAQGPNGAAAFPIRLYYEKGEPVRVEVLPTGSQIPVFLDMRQMTELRYILAAQNGYAIPDDNANPELLKAEQYLQNQKQAQTVFRIEDLVASVAVNCGAKTADVWDWPIREFENIQEAIDRKLGYQIYTLAEATGLVKFKKGNPYPTWKLNRRVDMPAGFQNLEDLDKSAHGLLQNITKE